MIVTPRPIQQCFDFEVAKASGGPRSPGLHLSDIYGALFKERYPERYDKPDSGAKEVYMELGLALELMIEAGLKLRHAYRPEEHRTPEGIYFSPDLIIEEDDRILLGEIKCTWMSSKEVPREKHVNAFPPKFDKYLVQMKGYCRSLGTPYARLFVFFVNGKWNCKLRREQPVPELLIWDLTFTEQELEENWLMLINYARSKGMLDASDLQIAPGPSRRGDRSAGKTARRRTRRA
jgi:hypothetical protein